MARKRIPRTILLDGESLTLDQAFAISRGAAIDLHPAVAAKVSASRQTVERQMPKHRPVYGVNTGFGFLANQLIPPKQLKELQRNILRSHAAGHGNPLSIPETRLAMALRLNVLSKGTSGVRFELCKALLQLIHADIYPVIPEFGSVGASGDLAPLAHLALPLIGEGKVQYQERVVPAMEALVDAGLEPFALAEKEGLALINGTQIMLSVGGITLAQSLSLLVKADQTAALSYEALQANPLTLDARIHRARGQRGQILSAQTMREQLEGSYLYKPRMPYPRVQDPYSLRCVAQVHGASRDAISYSCEIIDRELNASTDNPLVFADSHQILSGGNFHGQPLAMAFDIAAIALAELSSISERRLELLLNPHLSGLAAFLAAKPGLESGYMAVQYLSASLVNEGKLLANPACTDSIPGNVGIEDHVSMGMTSARKLKRLFTHVETVLAIETMAAAQAIDLRRCWPLGRGTQQIYNKLRSHVAPLTTDRIVAHDVEAALIAFQAL